MSDINKRAKQGIKLLMGRQVLLQIITFGCGIILARVLGPAQFGLYAIASFLVNSFALFGDFGLAPSLIQRKEELDERDLRVAFTLQQTLISVIVIVLLCVAPFLAHLYPKAPPTTVWLVRALALNLYLVSWRTMSALQLERVLKFGQLAWIEVVEALTYQITAVWLAVTHHGVWSYAIAMILSGVVGNILIYRASPWRFRFGFDRVIAKRIMGTGVHFQMQRILNSMGDWATPLFVGTIIGPQAVGLLTWASSNGRKPLLLVSNIVRVSFPHFSRIQDDKEEVERLLLKYFGYLLIPASLWFVLIVAAGPHVVQLIYTTKWVAAVPALMLFSFALSFDVMSWMATSTLNGIGRTAYANKIYVIRSIGNILMAVLFVTLFGFIGVAIAYTITVLWSSLRLLDGVSPGAAKNVLVSVRWLVYPVVVGIASGRLIGLIPLPIVVGTVLALVSATVLYSVTLWIAAPDWIRQAIRSRLPGRLSLRTA